MGKVSRRKRLYPAKKRRNVTPGQVPPATEETALNATPVAFRDEGNSLKQEAVVDLEPMIAVDEVSIAHVKCEPGLQDDSTVVGSTPDPSVGVKHELPSQTVDGARQEDFILPHDLACISGEQYVQESVPLHPLLFEVKEKLDVSLFQRWISIVGDDAVYVLLISKDKNNKTIQRSLECYASGKLKLYVHGGEVSVDQFVERSRPLVPLTPGTVEDFVIRIMGIVREVKLMEVCGGIDNTEFKDCWKDCTFGVVDTNPFQEIRYTETFKSPDCLKLVKPQYRRCVECSKLLRPLKRRSQSLSLKTRDAATPNVHLSEEQKLRKLQTQQKVIEVLKKKISRLKSRMQESVDRDGDTIDEDLSDDLTEV